MERLRVGDRVECVIGTMIVTADVVRDDGDIGVGGRQLVTLSRVTEWGEIDRFTLPAEVLTKIRPRSRRADRNGKLTKSRV